MTLSSKQSSNAEDQGQWTFRPRCDVDNVSNVISDPVGPRLEM